MSAETDTYVRRVEIYWDRQDPENEGWVYGIEWVGFEDTGGLYDLGEHATLNEAFAALLVECPWYAKSGLPSIEDFEPVADGPGWEARGAK